MIDQPTISDLVKAKVITSEQVDAATDALLADAQADSFPIAEGYVLDLGATPKAHQPFIDTLATPGTPQRLRHIMARTALMLSRPEKA